MQITLLVVFVVLLSLHQATAESSPIERCVRMCMKYSKCLQNQQMGLPDMKICFQPPCKCEPSKPVIIDVPKAEPCMEPRCPKVASVDKIIDPCDAACMRYSHCLAMGSVGCMKLLPPDNCKCSADMDAPCMGPRCPKVAPVDKIIDPCDAACMTYSQCLAEGSVGCMMLLPPGDCKCSEAMDAPCMGPRCLKVAPVDEIIHRCDTPCMLYSQCRADGNLHCMKPTGCMCFQMAEMAVRPRFPREKCFLVCMNYRKCIHESMTNPNPSQACVRSKECEECSRQPEVDPMPVVPMPMPVVPKPMPVVPKPMPVVPKPMPVVPKPMPVVPKPMPVVPKPMPVVPVEENMCSNEKCADFWMCTWMAPRDEKFACVKPAGCKCDCVAAGICVAPPNNPEIARNSEPWDGEEDLHMPLQPGRGHWGFRRCQSNCAMYRVCSGLIVNRGVKRPICEEPVGCNCRRFP